MDQGRLADIKRLNEVINNPNKSKGVRRTADKTKKIIVKQLRDPKLRRLRYQLINAARHHDEKAELKIMNTIKNYLKQEQIEV
jgi:hypothetical protein